MNKQEQVNRNDVQHQIVELKNKYPILKNTHSKVLQYENYRIFSSIKGLSKSKKNGNKIGRLRFKSRNRFSSFNYNQSGFKLIQKDSRYNILHLSKIGDIKIRQHRDVIGNIKQIQIKLKPTGWYSYIITDGKYECKNINKNQIGIDMGILSFITTSNKQVIRNPLFMNQQLQKIKTLSKKLSRTKKRSNNRKKVIFKLLRLWEKITNQKQDYFHKITTELVKNNNWICMEDLDIKNMSDKKGKNRYRNMRNILDSSWAIFTKMLKIKVSSTESELLFVNPKNTSKICSNCGNIKQDLTLADRTYNCDCCNISLDRDYNAAINIYKRGKELTFVGEKPLGISMNQEATTSTHLALGCEQFTIQIDNLKQNKK